MAVAQEFTRADVAAYYQQLKAHLDDTRIPAPSIPIQLWALVLKELRDARQDLDAAQTAFQTLKARVDAVGIP